MMFTKRNVKIINNERYWLVIQRKEFKGVVLLEN